MRVFELQCRPCGKSRCFGEPWLAVALRLERRQDEQPLNEVFRGAASRERSICLPKLTCKLPPKGEVHSF